MVVLNMQDYAQADSIILSQRNKDHVQFQIYFTVMVLFYGNHFILP